MKNDKYDGPYKHNEKLNLAEIITSNPEAFRNYDGKDLLESLDLDQDTKNFSAKEYASYIYALDKINGVDGELSMKEVNSLEFFNEDIKKEAQEIFDENSTEEVKTSFWERLGNCLERICKS